MFTLFFLGPMVFMFVGSLKPNQRVLADMRGWRALVPYPFTLENYVNAFDRATVAQLFVNSVIIIVGIVGLGLVVNSLFGYALARLRFRGKSLVLLLVIALLIVPFQAVAVPLLFMAARSGSIDTYHVQILPSVASPFFIYMFYTFFLNTPRELEEAARVDGAGFLRTFISISAPLARPAFATMAILSFIFNWGELLWPVMVTRGLDVRPLPLGIATFQTMPPVQWGDIMAFASIMTIPVLLVFLLAQRSFVEGVAHYGVKG